MWEKVRGKFQKQKGGQSKCKTTFRFVVDGIDWNPTINATEGELLTFGVTLPAGIHNFAIHVSAGSTNVQDRWNGNFTNQGLNSGNLSFTIDAAALAAGVLYYQCEFHSFMWGTIVARANVVTAPPAVPPSQDALIAHIALMAVASAVVIPAGVLTSSFMPYQFTVVWLPLHVGLQVVGVSLTLAGFACVLYYKSITGSAHFTNAHHIIGIIIISALLVQIILGVSSDVLWRWRFKKTGVMPLPGVFPERTHWWVGRGIVVLLIVQVFLGVWQALPMFNTGAWVYGVFGAWYGLLIPLSAVLLFLVRAQVRKAKEAKNARDRVGGTSSSSQVAPVSL